MSKINWDNVPDWVTHAVYRKYSGLIIFFNDSKYVYGEDLYTVYHYSEYVYVTFKEHLQLGAEERPCEYKGFVRESTPMSGFDPIKEEPKEWDGEGFPPVGTVCDIESGYTPFVTHDKGVTVLGYNDENTWLKMSDGEHINIKGGELRYIKADKRTDKEKAIDEMKSLLAGSLGLSYDEINEVSNLLYDAGYRKESDNE